MAAAGTHDLTEALAESLRDGDFVKLTLAGYRGAENDLLKILVRRIVVKKNQKLSFTYRYKTRDIVKNYDMAEGMKQVADFLPDFAVATLLTTRFDLKLENGKLRKTAPTHSEPASLDHDRPKQRLVGSARPYLRKLGITDQAGNVKPTAQDKFRQINKYIEILGGLVARLPMAKGLRVADMGAGKGYLTFALYDHFAEAGLTPAVTGVEFRPDLVALCNRIAQEEGFTGLSFAEGAIDRFDAAATDVLIALHACDTATDDAIAKGIKAGASLIVVAPCCHKQIRREMEAAKPAPALDFLLRHGSFMERQAEMVTDGLRAALLELHGYKTNVFEFISDAHTPKNVMITAIKSAAPTAGRQRALETEIAQAKAQFGIRQHYLETLLG